MVRFGLVRSTLAVLVVSAIFSGASLADTNKPFFENNVDRWGADYSVFDVTSGDASACHQACAKDKQCLAWTFHRPGTKGKLGECHLKSKVSQGRSNPCCISGVLIGQDADPDDADRSAVISGHLTGTRFSSAEKSVSRGKKGFFRKAALTQGEAVGLPELSVAAATPPLKITPVSFASSDEF